MVASSYQKSLLLVPNILQIYQWSTFNWIFCIFKNTRLGCDTYTSKALFFQNFLFIFFLQDFYFSFQKMDTKILLRRYDSESPHFSFRQNHAWPSSSNFQDIGFNVHVEMLQHSLFLFFFYLFFFYFSFLLREDKNNSYKHT